MVTLSLDMRGGLAGVEVLAAEAISRGCGLSADVHPLTVEADIYRVAGSIPATGKPILRAVRLVLRGSIPKWPSPI